MDLQSGAISSIVLLDYLCNDVLGASELEPQFYSDFSSFRVTLYNLNYNVPVEEAVVPAEKQFIDGKQTVRLGQKQSVEQCIHGLIASNFSKINC